jgi:hypothetical protein
MCASGDEQREAEVELEQVAGYLILCVLMLLAHKMLNVHTWAAAGRQLAALGQATAAGEPFSYDVRASLSVRRPDRLLQKDASGVVHIRPGSVCWEQHSRRPPVTFDLSAAVIASESRPNPRWLLGLMDYDYVAKHLLTLRCGDETIDLLIRRPLAQLVKAGLEQAANAGRRELRNSHSWSRRQKRPSSPAPGRTPALASRRKQQRPEIDDLSAPVRECRRRARRAA